MMFETDQISDLIPLTCNAKTDYEHFDSLNLWNVIYERLKNQATLLNKNMSCDVARGIENRWKNRYRDINPYDDTRVCICSLFDGDYINASYVTVPEAPSRKYILTQGPMQQTAPHFWLMVWERRSPAIIMLNRIYEKGIMRCYPYFPHEDGPVSLCFDEVGLCVSLENETRTHVFTKRNLRIVNNKTGEQHQVLHLHYTNWPDFGVPKSPSGMLNFLWAVRSTGALSDPEHPAVIHCSAGVGRSGAFVLVDLALHLVEFHRTIDAVDIGQLFFNLRRCRMGVIQTADQLRFCYAAILRGADAILNTDKDALALVEFEPIPGEEDPSPPGSDSDDGWDDFDDDDDDDASSSAEDEVDEVKDAEGLLEDLEVAHTNDLPLIEAMLVHTDKGSISPVAYTRWSHNNGFSPSSALTCSTSEKPLFNGDAWTDQSAFAPSVNQPTFHHQFHFADVNRSNSAFLDSTMEEEWVTPAHQEVSDHEPVDYPQTAMVSDSSVTTQSTEAASTIVTEHSSNPDGDNTSVTREADEHVATEPVEAEVVQQQAAESDPLTSEYLEVLRASQRRREARRQRQLRLQSQIERVQQIMRESDLERKRWLPVGISRYLRRFFSESGIVQTPQGAVVGSAAVLLLAMSFAFAGYRFYFGIF